MSQGKLCPRPYPQVFDVRVIPVMDLLGGMVVHAVRGERKKYQPIKSTLTESSDPLSMAMSLDKLGFEELYIADLDAISSAGSNIDLIGEIASGCRMKLMVDAGFRRAGDVEDYIEKGVVKIVLATETLGGWNEISKVITYYNTRVVASIDLKSGRVIARSKTMSLPLEELVAKFEAEGASEILLLSLDKVGTAGGPDHKIVNDVLDCATVPVLVGGGIRDIADIRHLQKQGVSGVLVATALHSGTLRREELDNLPHRMDLKERSSQTCSGALSG